MSAPPGSDRVAGARRNHISESNGAVGHALVAQMTAKLRGEPEAAGLSENKLSRLVRARIAEDAGRERRVIAYADPVGETAARNVDRARR